jgi:peroxiredoxin
MKTRHYVLGVLSLFLVLILSALYVYGMTKVPSPINENGEGPILDVLFREMGMTGVPPTLVPGDIKLKGLKGAMVKVSDFRGKIVFLNFWAAWCPACRLEMPSMEKLHNRFRNKDFAMIAIDLEEPASTVRDFFKEFHLTFTALLDSDGEAADLFGVTSIPVTFVLDKEGKIIGGALGAREWDNQESAALFEHLVNQGVMPPS